MNCVSYTRSVSWRAGENNTIGQQNERIRSFMKEKGLKLSAMYSDRKQSVDVDTGFREMVDDALQHKFDCLIVDSIAHIGNGRGAVKKVLGKTFFPLGIDFCVAEDNFCSFENSREDVWKYIDSSFRKNISANLVKRLTDEGRAGLLNCVDEKYGYVLNADRTGLVIDNEAAEVVREIFRLYLEENESSQTIANILTERQILSPLSYMQKKDDSREWNCSMVTNILQKKCYTGSFTKTVDGVERLYITEPIISQEIYASAQKRLEEEYRVPIWKIYFDIYRGKVIDADSGKKFLCNVQSDNSVVFTDGKALALPLENIENAVKIALKSELSDTARFKEFHESEQARTVLDAEREKYRQRARELFAVMSEEAEKRLPLYQRFQSGEISETEYKEELAKHRQIIADYDKQMEGLVKDCAETEKYVSKKNEWYCLYSQMEIPKHFTRRFILKYVKAVYVGNRSEIMVEIYHKECKKYMYTEVR